MLSHKKLHGNFRERKKSVVVKGFRAQIQNAYVTTEGQPYLNKLLKQ